MRDYFLLQKTLLERQLRALELAPWVVYLVAPVLFFCLGWLLLGRGDWAVWLVVFMGASTVNLLGTMERNDFLRGLFLKGDYRKIRLIENGLVVLPFVLLLLVRGFWGAAAGAGGVGLAMSVLTSRGWNAWVLPTPFSRNPFEFAIGFRKYWWMLLIALFLLVMGIRADNFELSLFAYFVTVFIGCQSHANPEPGFFVWIHTFTPEAFLRRKITLAIKHQLILCLPFLLAVLFFFPGQWMVCLVGLVLGLAYLVLWLTVKYSVFPNEIDIGQAFVIALGMIVFPTMLVIVPVFYARAKRRVALLLPAEHKLEYAPELVKHDLPENQVLDD
jgi:hypothetical protein